MTGADAQERSARKENYMTCCDARRAIMAHYQTAAAFGKVIRQPNWAGFNRSS